MQLPLMFEELNLRFDLLLFHIAELRQVHLVSEAAAHCCERPGFQRRRSSGLMVGAHRHMAAHGFIGNPKELPY